MTEIQIINIKRNPSYIEIFYKMWFILPTIYGTGAVPIKGLNIILTSFPDGFSNEVVGGITVITLSDTQSANSNITLAQIKTQLQTKYTQVRTKLDSLTLTPYDTIAGLSWDGTTWA